MAGESKIIFPNYLKRLFNASKLNDAFFTLTKDLRTHPMNSRKRKKEALSKLSRRGQL
jgi:hypothetical protein